MYVYISMHGILYMGYAFIHVYTVVGFRVENTFLRGRCSDRDNFSSSSTSDLQTEEKMM